jgi:hypothetical protein
MSYAGVNQSQERIQSLDFSNICFSYTSCICSSNLFGKEISVRRTIVLCFQEIDLTDPIALGHELRFSPFLAEVFLHFFVDNI